MKGMQLLQALGHLLISKIAIEDAAAQPTLFPASFH
jgi:hypothetical protein